MPRARRSPPKDRDKAIAQFAEHHILDIRRNPRGQIQKVKHVQWGWIEPETYYQLQQIHAFMPLIVAFVEGGYRAKAALWGLSVGIAGVEIPVGAYIPVKGMALAAGSFAAGDTMGGIKWTLATLLPFGDVLILLQIFREALQLEIGAVEGITVPLLNLLLENPWLGGPIIGLTFPGVKLP